MKSGNDEKFILLIDDEVCKVSYLWLRLFRRFASEKGYRLVVECRAEDGVHIAVRNQERIVLVIMDGSFLDQALQGPEAARRIRENTCLPVMMFSSSNELNRKGVAAGASGYATKGGVREFEVCDVVCTMERLLSAGRQAESLAFASGI